MKDIRPIVAANLSYFRKESGLTQAELAAKLNYSDKAISRWERGDTLPDINVLYELCTFYGITLDTLTKEDASLPDKEKTYGKDSTPYKVVVMLLSVAVVWICATILFVYSNLSKSGEYFWMAFVWAVPVTAITLNISGRTVFNEVVKVVFDSVFVWTVLVCIYLWLLSYNIWMIFLLGVPIQMVLILWMKMKKYK